MNNTRIPIQLKYAITYTAINIKHVINKNSSRWRLSLHIANVENPLVKYKKTNKPTTNNYAYHYSSNLWGN